MRVFTVVSLFLLAIVDSTSAQLGDYYPLVPGWSWSYESGYQQQIMELEVLDETRTVRGVQTLVLRREISSQYWPTRAALWFMTKNAEGDVYLHGFEDVEDGSRTSFVPPILIVDQPLDMWKTWATRSAAYQGLEAGGPLMFHFIELYRVTDEFFYNFTSGTLYCLGLTRTMTIESSAEKISSPPLLSERFSDEDATVYYSQDIGTVIELTFLLQSFRQPVTNETSTLSAVKALYR